MVTPTITVTEGTSTTAPGTALAGGATTMREGQTKNLVIQVTDGTGRPLAGYNVNVTGTNIGRYALTPAGAGPASQHGVVPSTGLNRATNASGIVNVTYTPPAGSAGTPEAMTVTYQPDFDTDATFSPPEKGDDRETTLRRLYLYELRAAAKTWAGTGNNFGAIVSAAVAITIEPP
jgi:hypothetical protein